MNYQRKIIFTILIPLFMSIHIDVFSQIDVKMNKPVRINEKFDKDWQFHKGDIAMKLAVKSGQQGGLADANVKIVSGEEAMIAYTDKNKTAPYKASDWINVSLPHDWLVEESPVNDNTLGSQPGSNGFKTGGIGFYRKEFDVAESDKGKKISIEFDGIFRNSTVWVNGFMMGNHQSGYTPSNYDLSDILRYGKEGKNVILVKVDATENEGWWYEGAGIYRHVWMIKTNKTHIARFGTFVTTPVISDDKALVNINTTIQNEHHANKSIKIVSVIVDSNGKTLDTQTSTVQIKPLASEEIRQQGEIAKPLLWSPETPKRYKVLSSVYENDTLIDDYETVFGVRKIEFTTDGFFLNGKLYPIKGTANHQDFAGVGVALPDKINEYRIKLLKRMGSNGYRTAHNPPTPELLDICDSLGMLVLDENRHLSSSEEGVSDLRTLILRDRNHPSVFMWSLENEESIQGSVTGTRILRTLVETAHESDSTRLVTAAMNHGWNEGGYSDELDVVGYNYGQRGMQYVKDHQAYPQRKMLATESTSFVSTRGEYEDNDQKGYMSNFGKGVSWGLLPGEDWKHVVDYPYLSGTFVWTGFDYRGEPTPYLWPCVSSHFGIMDLCGFPKDGYFAYKAAWTDEPVVHVHPHWNLSGKEGQSVRMGVYTNCDEVELFVNGKSLGRKKAQPYTQLEWQAIYSPGKLKAVGYKNEKIAIMETTETTGSPTQIVLSADTLSLKADGCDVAIVNVALKDAKNRVVPVANNLITFEVEGDGHIIGTGNGDPSSHESEKSNERHAFNGYCQVLIQSNSMKGQIRLKASSPEMKSSEIVIKTR